MQSPGSAFQSVSGSNPASIDGRHGLPALLPDPGSNIVTPGFSGVPNVFAHVRAGFTSHNASAQQLRVRNEKRKQSGPMRRHTPATDRNSTSDRSD
jgi:hypothetical protein